MPSLSSSQLSIKTLFSRKKAGGSIDKSVAEATEPATEPQTEPQTECAAKTTTTTKSNAIHPNIKQRKRYTNKFLLYRNGVQQLLAAYKFNPEHDENQILHHLELMSQTFVRSIMSGAVACAVGRKSVTISENDIMHAHTAFMKHESGHAQFNGMIAF